VEEWRVGLHVTAHLNKPKLEWNTFTISTRMGKNMTLSRNLPGRIVLKAIMLATRNNGGVTTIPIPHVWMDKRDITFLTGDAKAIQLVEIFHCHIWLMGMPLGL
jgi:hypothetical protein